MSFKTASFGLEEAVEVIGGKWKPLILREVNNGWKRPGELRRQVQGITEKMLLMSLKELEAHGVLRRKDFHEVPLRVEYSLTKSGEALVQALQPLCQWGAAHRKKFKKAAVLATPPAPPAREEPPPGVAQTPRSR